MSSTTIRLRRLRPGVCVAVITGVVLLAASCAGTETPTESSVTGARPNFVIMIADDMNWDDCGVCGRDTIRTPSLDRMARNGMMFHNAVLTASSCSPSRASIITGRYPHNTNAEQLHWPLPGEQATFVEKLKQAGYWTAAAGKWHLGDEVRDRFDVIRDAGAAGFQLQTDAAGRQQAMVAEQESGTEEWLNVLRARDTEKPFFLWLASLDPHRDYKPGILERPHQPEDVFVPPYLPDTPEVRRDLALYYDEITRLDDAVGQVMAELEVQGVADNTFVLFFSDNGRPFPRAKTTLYDSGIRTPFIVHWPGKVRAGSESRSVVSSVDIAPTVLELAKVPIPEGIQGTSFVPVLEDPSRQTRQFAFAEDHWHDYADHGRAVRSQQFKYIRNDYVDLPNTPPADVVRSPSFVSMRTLRDAGKLTSVQTNVFKTPRPAEELYDLLRDPFELTNVAAVPEYAAALTEMRTQLEQWTRETGDRLPSVRTPDEFDRELGTPTPARVRPRASKAEMIKAGVASP